MDMKMRTIILVVTMAALMLVGHAQADFGDMNTGAILTLGGDRGLNGGALLGLECGQAGGHKWGLQGTYEVNDAHGHVTAGPYFGIPPGPHPSTWLAAGVIGPDKWFGFGCNVYSFSFGSKADAAPAKAAAVRPKFAPVTSDAPADIRPVALTTAMRDF
jgi:hypothetical protein